MALWPQIPEFPGESGGLGRFCVGKYGIPVAPPEFLWLRFSHLQFFLGRKIMKKVLAGAAVLAALAAFAAPAFLAALPII